MSKKILTGYRINQAIAKANKDPKDKPRKINTNMRRTGVNRRPYGDAWDLMLSWAQAVPRTRIEIADKMEEMTDRRPSNPVIMGWVDRAGLVINEVDNRRSKKVA